MRPSAPTRCWALRAWQRWPSQRARPPRCWGTWAASSACSTRHRSPPGPTAWLPFTGSGLCGTARRATTASCLPSRASAGAPSRHPSLCAPRSRVLSGTPTTRARRRARSTSWFGRTAAAPRLRSTTAVRWSTTPARRPPGWVRSSATGPRARHCGAARQGTSPTATRRCRLVSTAARTQSARSFIRTRPACSPPPPSSSFEMHSADRLRASQPTCPLSPLATAPLPSPLRPTCSCLRCRLLGRPCRSCSSQPSSSQETGPLRHSQRTSRSSLQRSLWAHSYSCARICRRWDVAPTPELASRRSRSTLARFCAW